MDAWLFAPDGMVPESMPRENANVISMGGWQFSARPTSPMQRKFRVRLHGMKWFLDNGTAGNYDTVTSPTINARKLEQFYDEHEMWSPFIFPHPHLGNIVVRFASPLSVPAGAPNSYGLIEPFEVELVETGIAAPAAFATWPLGLDFVNGEYWRNGELYSLSAISTFTRASTGTRTNIAGALESVAVDTPRFDYDPVTHLPAGLLLEQSAQNLFLNALLNGTNLSTQSVTVTAQPYTISFYGTGTITLSGAHAQAVAGTGAYPSRRTYTFTPSAGSLTCTVSGSVQYAQLETGIYPSTFIPTAGSAVTRAEDLFTMTSGNLTSWFNGPAGTIVTEQVTNQPDNGLGTGTDVSNVSVLLKSTAGNLYVVNKSDTSTRVNALSASRIVSSAALTLESADGVFLPNVVNRIAYTYNETADTHGMSINGITPITGSFTNNVMPAPTTLSLSVGFNTRFRFLGFKAEASTNTQLQALSTP